MKLRLPLAVKICGWLLLNLVLVAAALALLFRKQIGLGWDSLLSGAGGARVQAVGELIADEIRSLPPPRWGEVLHKYQTAYGVQFAVFRTRNEQLAGDPLTLPEAFAQRMGSPPPPPAGPPERRRPGEGGRFRGGRPPEDGRPPADGPSDDPFAPPPPPPLAEGRPPGEREYRKFVVRTTDPTRYWIGVRIPAPAPREFRESGFTGRPAPRESVPVTLAIMSESFRAGGLFLDPTPWVLTPAAILLFSALFWFPLVRGITHALGRMTRAAEQMAQGDLDTRVRVNRGDELGRLATALNHMAERLREYFLGQKRFLGDVAHELCSPLARMEMALSVLEQRADERQRDYVNDVRDEVREMSALVNELLSFSKAGVRGKDIQLQPVQLSELATRVAAREAGGSANTALDVDDSIFVQAEPELLARALANVIRNAVRYAGDAGPIVVSATNRGEEVELAVIDNGPGVPPEALHRLFDPFFRPETARTRETGGAGLGLAIVKSCIEACRGTVTARNREPHGFEVCFRLAAGSESRLQAAIDHQPGLVSR